jgi:hypothetical protein
VSIIWFSVVLILSLCITPHLVYLYILSADRAQGPKEVVLSIRWHMNPISTRIRNSSALQHFSLANSISRVFVSLFAFCARSYRVTQCSLHGECFVCGCSILFPHGKTKATHPPITFRSSYQFPYSEARCEYASRHQIPRINRTNQP